jgi:hypothetical protein
MQVSRSELRWRRVARSKRNLIFSNSPPAAPASAHTQDRTRVQHRVLVARVGTGTGVYAACTAAGEAHLMILINDQLYS